MARIRSIHPGLFTDEAFVALSSDAQVFFLGLWTEADDQGIFEWKPITLRMRLRPGRDGAVDPFLDELVAVQCIQKFEAAGRFYGAIRNFRKFQRPKKPNSVHPMPDEIRTYVAIDDVSTELLAVQEGPVLQKGEMSPQMEDVGDKMKEVIEESPSLRSAPETPPRRSKPVPKTEPPGFAAFYAAYPLKKARPAASKAYGRALERAPPEVLLDGAKRYSTQRENEDQKFTKHPATWLNNDCWLDQEVSNESRNGDGRNKGPNAHEKERAGWGLVLGASDGRPEDIPRSGQLALTAQKTG